ncbi:MAG TPA: MerR family transcriptional regulator [Candidatus Excrementavichristensenella intestinipullorum]|nr:MerR family transcriptional regulator [Candidatus Excrementavichristensenella intestinipullorum]
MYYTIKTISDLIGITPQTIRYYEENGVLSPKRDARNGYRYYTVWDYGILLMARRYLRYGCSVAKSSELLNNTSVERTIDATRRQEAQLEEEIADKLRILDNLRKWRALLEAVGQGTGACRIDMRPGLFRMENMEDTTFLPEKEIYQRTKQWLAMTPFVFNTIRYPLEDVQKDTCHRFSALGILEENARLWNIQADQYVTYYPPRLCVIQTIGGEGFDTMLPLSRRIGKAMSFLAEKGLSLTGDIITRMDYAQKSASGYCSYQTAWFPID